MVSIIRTAHMFKPLLSCARPVGVGALVAAALALSGCASFQNAGTQMSTLGGLLTPHRMDIQQGNVVVREQMKRSTAASDLHALIHNWHSAHALA